MSQIHGMPQTLRSSFTSIVCTKLHICTDNSLSKCVSRQHFGTNVYIMHVVLYCTLNVIARLHHHQARYEAKCLSHSSAYSYALDTRIDYRS